MLLITLVRQDSGYCDTLLVWQEFTIHRGFFGGGFDDAHTEV